MSSAQFPPTPQQNRQMGSWDGPGEEFRTHSYFGNTSWVILTEDLSLILTFALSQATSCAGR